MKNVLFLLLVLSNSILCYSSINKASSDSSDYNKNIFFVSVLREKNFIYDNFKKYDGIYADNIYLNNLYFSFERRISNFVSISFSINNIKRGYHRLNEVYTYQDKSGSKTSSRSGIVYRNYIQFAIAPVFNFTYYRYKFSISSGFGLNQELKYYNPNLIQSSYTKYRMEQLNKLKFYRIINSRLIAGIELNYNYRLIPTTKGTDLGISVRNYSCGGGIHIGYQF